MPTTLEQLVAQVESDRLPVAEIFQKIPELITGNSSHDVTFNVTPPVSFPSIAKLESQLSTAGLTTAQNRQASLENIIQGLIQQSTQVSQQLNLTMSSPYWSKLDIKSPSSTGVNATDPLFRSRVENGIRFDFDAFHPVQLDRQFGTDGKKVGDWLMPACTETTVNLYTSALPASGDTATTQENVAKYRAFQKQVKTYETVYNRYYYGYYYHWYRYYWGIAATSYTTEKVSTVYESLSKSLAAQTFKIDDERVILGVNVLVKAPGTNKGTAIPQVYLTKTSLGMPVLDQILAKATLLDDSAAASTANAVLVRFNFDTAVMLRANEQYALVFVAADQSTWSVWHNSNEHGKGAVFFTQDGSYWQSDLAKDFIVQLVTADFGSGVTTATIPMGNISVSGGIASINLNKVVVAPTNGNVSFQVETTTGNWVDASVLNSMNALPANVNLRAVFTGSRYTMPLVDTRNSVMTGFRPTTVMKFISNSKPVPTTENLRIIYNLAGYDETETGSGPMNTFTPKIKIGASWYTPDVMTVDTSEDGTFTKVEAVYTLPVGATTYIHDIAGETLLATKTYDIISVVQLNQ